MTTDVPLRRSGRAGALLLTGLVLVATSGAIPAPTVQFDVTGSCGPAGRITIRDHLEGCGGDPSEAVEGAAEVGLPSFAGSEETKGGAVEFGPETPFVMAGTLVLPGSQPPVSVHRTCRVEPEVAGVRAFTCEGDPPEAACEGTLTLVPRPAPGVTP